MKWLVPSRDWFVAPAFHDDADFQNAVLWAREFTPERDKESYSVACEHAKRKYDQTVAHFDALDKKADDLMKTAVTIAALLVGAIKALEVGITIWLISAFLAFLGTIILAAIARRPTLQATPGSVHELMGFVEDFRIHDRYQIEALVAASLRCAIVGTSLSIRWKSNQLSRATVLFVSGVLLLLSVFV